jgi:diacylglycerol kinase (ATP)
VTRAVVIANPGAGTDRARALLPLIESRLRTIASDLDVIVTDGPDDVERAAMRARDHADAVFVAGGDGTINRTVRGLMAGGATPRIPIGIIPTGTGNDFARALGLDADPERALDTLLEGRTVRVDVGTMNGVPFLNASAGGFVADVSEAVTEGLKDAAGRLAYLVGGARALFGSTPFAARIAIVDAGYERVVTGSLDLRMFAVCNARFIGGGYPIAPGAVIDDGQADVLVVPDMPMLEFVGVLQRIAAGEQHDHPGLLHFRASAFDFEFSRTIRVNTDGEVLEAAAAAYRMQPRAARFFCGPNAHAALPLGIPRT